MELGRRMLYKGVSVKELNKKQTKEYFEKVTRNCINSWELYNAHMYVAISDSRGYWVEGVR